MFYTLDELNAELDRKEKEEREEKERIQRLIDDPISTDEWDAIQPLIDSAVQKAIEAERAKGVYLVGGWNGYDFLVDRVFYDKEESVQYCKSRLNTKYDWEVLHIGFGNDWINRQHVFYVTKTGC